MIHINADIHHDTDRKTGRQETSTMQFDRKDLLLYAVTDRKWVGTQTLEEQVEAAIKGGATMIQIREKKMAQEEFLQEARRIRSITKKYQIPLIINDNVELAIACDADGVHVGQSDMEACQAREKLGRDKIVGVTARTVEQAKTAQKNGADYLGVGAVFGSSTKLDAKPLSKEDLRTIAQSVSIPIVGIGGIDQNNMLELEGTGIAGVAVVSGIFGQKDIEAAAKIMADQAQKLFS